MKCPHASNLLALTTVFCAWSSCWSVCSASEYQIDLIATDDASLYQYDHSRYDPTSPETFVAADGTSHLHVGDTNNNNGVQRGLLRFDVSEIPGNAYVTEVSLQLSVADVPSRVLQRDVNFWVVPLERLNDPWSAGPGNERSPAVPGDTTWYHTQYDPALHGQLGNTTDNPFLDFIPGGAGYWPAPGYFGQDDLADTAPGAGVGGPFDDADAHVFPEGTDVGDRLEWNNQRLVSDVQAWIDGSQQNYGWILIGEEWITSDQEVIRPDNGRLANASSKIDFFSSDSAPPFFEPPVLSVTYSAIPEPSSLATSLAALMLFSLAQRVRLLSPREDKTNRSSQRGVASRGSARG